ncbi:heme NO-binding domain-containing protein [Natronolimnobius baerhuensis]|uniref:Heme NO-binding domain-containing protein n=1 Tax=Natronolimnobius baerhuensis TaxID=253108 RepID=A0A202E5Z4_9EURY|nr:heme NO-binding domain-containing protein [Natronolimnobius baerhuensis]OVE83649.1 hypothetical protein B2G88_14560 [Natronolimnobius baerhuensis]
MHGILHKTLEEYIIDRTDEDTWETIRERADLEPTLYLQVSHYDDDEFEAILETLSSMATQDRPAIERDFGRSLAPAIRSTFGAYSKADWGILELLTNLEAVYAEIGNANDDLRLPDISTERDGETVLVRYRTPREQHYCHLAHGILEGLSTVFEADATVTKEACLHDGDDCCQFSVTLE